MRVFDLKKIWGVIWPYLIFIAVTTIMIFYQLKAGVFTSGADTFFHSARFYDAAMQIKIIILVLFNQIMVFNSQDV